jgi:enterochelin esterase-like enzyme
VEAHDARRPLEGAEHHADPAVLSQVRGGLGPASDVVVVLDRERIDDPQGPDRPLRAEVDVSALERGALCSALVLAVSGSPAAPGDELETGFHSRALRGTLRLVVVLPHGYASSNRRYPVVYFLHGLPASPYAFRSVGFLERALDGLGSRAILVSPQGARDGDSDPEYLDWGPGRNWETAVGEELPRYVDTHFRTLRTRQARALVGLSAGGYGATLLAFHHLDEFGVVESWSGYFHPTDPTGTEPLPLGPEASAHTFVRRLRADELRRPTFLAFYVGRGDRRFRAENKQLDRELRAAGVPHLFRVYPGAHEQTVWTAHARVWLGLALAHLQPAR